MSALPQISEAEYEVIRYGTKWRNLCNNCVAKIYRKNQ